MPRRLQNPLIALLVLVVALPACDELTGGLTDEVPGLDPDLVGEWIATEMLFTSTENSGMSVDAIPLTGMFMGITFNADSTVQLTQWDPSSESWYNDAATWSAADGQLTLHWQGDDEPEIVTYSFPDDGHVSVAVGEDEEWDFDGDGTYEPASLDFIFADAESAPDTDLVGAWSATSFVFTSVADPNTSVDLIEHGATFMVTLNADASYGVDASYPDGEGGTVEETEAGEYVATDGLLWITEEADNGPDLVLYTVDGSSATISTDHDVYDFDGDGTDEPATLVITFNKQ